MVRYSCEGPTFPCERCDTEKSPPLSEWTSATARPRSITSFNLTAWQKKVYFDPEWTNPNPFFSSESWVPGHVYTCHLFLVSGLAGNALWTKTKETNAATAGCASASELGWERKVRKPWALLNVRFPKWCTYILVRYQTTTIVWYRSLNA